MIIQRNVKILQAFAETILLKQAFSFGFPSWAVVHFENSGLTIKYYYFPILTHDSSHNLFQSVANIGP